MIFNRRRVLRRDSSENCKYCHKWREPNDNALLQYSKVIPVLNVGVFATSLLISRFQSFGPHPCLMKHFMLINVLVLALALLCLPHVAVCLPYSPRGSPRKVYRGNGPIHEDTSKPYPQRNRFNDISEQSQPRERRDAVHTFTRSTKRKLLVSAVSAVTLVALVYFISTILFSTAPAMLLWFSVAGGAVGTFIKGDFGEFCRALGVCTLLLLQRTSLTRFLVKFVSQSKAALQLAGRRPFPPGSNPWRYTAAVDGGGGNRDDATTLVQFSMVSALMSISFAAAYVGYLLARVVPLLPNWIGALGGALTVGYATTLPNGRGDLLRYLGHCLTHCLAVVSQTLEDVQLPAKLSTLLGHVLFFSQALDSKYHLLARLQLLFTQLVSRITIIISRLRRDMSGNPNEQYYEYDDINDGSSAPGRRYGSYRPEREQSQFPSYPTQRPGDSQEQSDAEYEYDSQPDYQQPRFKSASKKGNAWW